MLIGINDMQPYPRQLLLVFLQAADNSPELTPHQKTLIEDACQRIVSIWTRKEMLEQTAKKTKTGEL